MRVLVVSDIHFAGPGERLRTDYEARSIPQPVPRFLLRAYRHYIWLRDPFAHNGLLDEFCRRAGDADLVVANGDYSCDSGFIGVSDNAARESAEECLARLRERYGKRLVANLGDHELGKFSNWGCLGGLRLESWRRCLEDLSLKPFWRRDFGDWTLLGVTSSLIALPVFEPEILPEERGEWARLREKHIRDIREAFAGLDPGRRVLLFLHDPTGIPFLWEEAPVRERIGQVEATIIGHLHSPLVFWKGRLLAGIPAIGWMGNGVRRISTALNRARCWRPFKVRLCPSLAGIELLKDGGFLELRLESCGLREIRHFLPRTGS